jgi:hypothetical protein
MAAQSISNIDNALNYVETLIGLPYRWYNSDVDTFNGGDKFWCENSPAPLADEIHKEDRSICCAGIPNLMRRCLGYSVPGLNGNIQGEYRELYEKYPGGTGAWFLYLYQNNRIEELDTKKTYPKGTLLLAQFKDNDADQGHLAVVYNEIDGNNNSQTICDQLIIHSYPTVSYNDKKNHKNHGVVGVNEFHISNNLWKYDSDSYYKFVCLPENWLCRD